METATSKLIKALQSHGFVVASDFISASDRELEHLDKMLTQAIARGDRYEADLAASLELRSAIREGAQMLPITPAATRLISGLIASIPLPKRVDVEQLKAARSLVRTEQTRRFEAW